MVAHKPVQELLEDILDLVAGYLPMDQCVIMLRGGGDTGLETRAARTQARGGEAREIRVSRTIVNMAYEQHLSVLLSDTMADPRVIGNVSIIDKGIRSALCVPIGDDMEVIGVLYADRQARHSPFQDADLRLLTLLANTAAVKIQQARQVEALVEAEKMRRELKIAADIQRDFLPRTLPAFAGYGMAGRAVPCFDVGGDYFDLISLGEERLGLAVADVSGKGVGAALLMASLRAWLRAELAHATDLATLAGKLNDFAFESCDIQSFITFFFADLDRGREPSATSMPGTIRPSSSDGTAPSGTFRRQGSASECSPAAVMRSGHPSSAPARSSSCTRTGSRKAGTPPARNSASTGLAGAVRAARDNDAPEILEEVFRRLAEFTAREVPLDDRTLVVVKRRPFESGLSL